MVEAWLARTAADFWARVGGAPPFPRDLDIAVQTALPASLLVVPRLDLAAVERELARLGLDHRFRRPNRRLRGCLVAHRGHGLILVDADDPPDERRFTVAHEAAHLVCDHLRRRWQAVDRVGPAAVEVLDGVRPPTAAERLDAALAGVPLGLQAHLLDRDAPLTVLAEDRADRLALELLAPADELGRWLLAGARRRGPVEQAAHAERVLRERFGLPAGVAEAYGRRLGASTAGLAPLAAMLRGQGVALPGHGRNNEVGGGR